MLGNIELVAGAEQYSYDPGTKYVYLANDEMYPDHYVSGRPALPKDSVGTAFIFAPFTATT